MKRVVAGATFADAYQKALQSVYTDPEYEARPRGLGIRECLDFTMVINNPTSRLYVNPVRSTPFRYMLAELCWYVTGERNVNWIKQFGSIWGKICNSDDTANSQYGYLTLYQRYADGISGYQYAYDCLMKDRDSRKAVILYNQPKYCAVDTGDTVCTFNNQFIIRNNKLHMITNMRSNDMIFGLPMDVVWFTKLQEQMLNDLQTRYPNLRMGKYYHTAGSMHIYGHQWPMVEKMLEEVFHPIDFDPVISRMFMYAERGVPVPQPMTDFWHIRQWLDGSATADSIRHQVLSRELMAMVDLAEFFETDTYDPEKLIINAGVGEDSRITGLSLNDGGPWWNMKNYDKPTLTQEEWDADADGVITSAFCGTEEKETDEQNDTGREAE